MSLNLTRTTRCRSPETETPKIGLSKLLTRYHLIDILILGVETHLQGGYTAGRILNVIGVFLCLDFARYECITGLYAGRLWRMSKASA